MRAAALAALAALVVGIALAQRAQPSADTPARVELGRRLFYDADLSDDGTMACATCHEQHRGFADGNRGHPGVHGETPKRNVPGLSNLTSLPSYTWGDPRIRTLEAQMLVPVLGDSPIEMGMKGREGEIARRIGADACYRTMFAEAFPETGGRIDVPAMAQAIASFERTLVSRDTPYDRGTLDPLARAGQALFARQCAGCHTGRDFSDGRFHTIIGGSATDRGLGEITGRPRDDGSFRTPSLRNVSVTQPYFHDGSAATIEAAIDRHPGHRTPAETAALAAFLRGLTDQTFLHDKRFGLPDHACGQPL